MLGTSRGIQNGSVRFLRFAVLEQAGDTIIMRLTSADRNQAVFEATDPAFDVKRIVYRARHDGAVDVVADRADGSGPYLVEFTLRRTG